MQEYDANPDHYGILHRAQNLQAVAVVMNATSVADELLSSAMTVEQACNEAHKQLVSDFIGKFDIGAFSDKLLWFSMMAGSNHCVEIFALECQHVAKQYLPPSSQLTG